MEAFNTDLTQVIKWMHNKAPNIQKLINSKNEWYKKYNDQFWENWERDVFNLDTVNEFGVYVWCEILNLPKENFIFEPIKNAWAYGKERQNYKYSGIDTTIPVANRNTVGGNFFGAGDDVVTSLKEARIILKLRYMTLISDGRIHSINRGIKFILDSFGLWDMAAAKIGYVIDAGATIPSTITAKPTITVEDWQGTWEVPVAVITARNPPNTDLSTIWSAASGGVLEKITAPDGTTAGAAVKVNSGAGPGAFSKFEYTGYAGITVSGFRFGYVRAVYVKLDGPNDLKMVRIRGGIGNAPANGWFTNQNAIFDFTGGDPVMSMELIPVSSDPSQFFPGSMDGIGFQKLGNGWYRIWNTVITSGYVGNAGIMDSKIMHAFEFYSKDGNNANKTYSVFGPTLWAGQVEGNKGPLPQPFMYSRTPAPVTFAFGQISGSGQGPYTFSIGQNATGTVGPAPVYTSRLIPGAKLYMSGNWRGQPIPKTLIAVGDGSTVAWSLTPPATYQPGYSGTGMQYRFSTAFGFSAQMLNMLKNRDLGILPANAGIPYSVNTF